MFLPQKIRDLLTKFCTFMTHKVTSWWEAKLHLLKGGSLRREKIFVVLLPSFMGIFLYELRLVKNLKRRGTNSGPDSWYCINLTKSLCPEPAERLGQGITVINVFLFFSQAEIWDLTHYKWTARS